MQSLHDWFATSPGSELAKQEVRLLSGRLAGLYARRVVQVGSFGVGHSLTLFGGARLWVLASRREAALDLQADPEVLPLVSGSVDVIILNHQLEFTRRPHQVIREAARVLAPEGHMIVLGFNPHSLWGLRQYWPRGRHHPPWSGRYLSAARIQDWMLLLGITPRRHESFAPVPPLGRFTPSVKTTQPVAYSAPLGPGLRWFGGVNLVMGQKRVNAAVHPPTSWRQRFEIIPGGLTQAGAGARHSREETSHDTG